MMYASQRVAISVAKLFLGNRNIYYSSAVPRNSCFNLHAAPSFSLFRRL